MNLLFPDKLAQQPPLIQLLWLTVLAVGSYCVLSSVAVLSLLISGAQLEDLANTDFSQLSGDGLFRYKILQILSTIALFVLPACLFARLQTPNLHYLNLHYPIEPIPTTWTIIIVLLSFPLIAWLSLINESIALPTALQSLETWMRGMENEAKEMTIAFLRMDSIAVLLLNLLMVAVLPALGEEMLFRGCIQRIFYRIFKSPHVAIWVAAALFSFIHFQFYGFLPRMIIGALLGYLYYFSGNLWYPIIGHFLNNGIQVVAVYMMPEQLNNVETAGVEHIPFYLPLIAIYLLYRMFGYFRQSADPLPLANARKLD